MIKRFHWAESQHKKRHFYVWCGEYMDPLGFVSFQWKGWKGKPYLPGTEARYFSTYLEATTYVEMQIIYFVNAMTAK